MEGNENIIQKLFSSFGELEDAIGCAKKTLLKKETVPEEIMERLDSYDGILEKQRVLATKLCHSIDNENWDEVNRYVGLINGLSAMIRDDARAILSSITIGRVDRLDKESNFC